MTLELVIAPNWKIVYSALHQTVMRSSSCCKSEIFWYRTLMRDKQWPQVSIHGAHLIKNKIGNGLEYSTYIQCRRQHNQVVHTKPEEWWWSHHERRSNWSLSSADTARNTKCAVNMLNTDRRKEGGECGTRFSCVVQQRVLFTNHTWKARQANCTPMQNARRGAKRSVTDW